MDLYLDNKLVEFGEGVTIKTTDGDKLEKVADILGLEFPTCVGYDPNKLNIQIGKYIGHLAWLMEMLSAIQEQVWLSCPEYDGSGNLVVLDFR